MNRATRIPSFVRRTGGLAASITHGAVLCFGLMGMAPVESDNASLVTVSYADTRQADTRAAELRTLVAAEPVKLQMVEETTRLPQLAVPAPRTEAKAQPAVVASVGLRAAALQAGLDGADDELSPEMLKVRDWVAERYRVSEESLEPALAAAEASASRLGFDPLLIVAIMAVESSFNPRAVSNMGAQGLMQVIPRYHQDKIGKQKSKYALFDPELNVRVGAEVLHEGLKRYGTMQRALQYYNGSLRDPKAKYTRKVLSVKKRLLNAAGRGPLESRITLSAAG